MMWHICLKCDKTLGSRQSLWRHQKNCQVLSKPVDDVEMEQTKNPNDEIILQSQSNEVVKDTNAAEQDRHKEKKKRKRFISVEMFNKLTVKPAIKWDDLSPGCIYKMEKVYNEHDEQIVADLTSRDETTIPVVLPEFVMTNLSPLTERNVIIYLRPYKSSDGEEQVELATVQKHACKNCSKEFSSSSTLWVHRKKLCKAQTL